MDPGLETGVDIELGAARPSQPVFGSGERPAGRTLAIIGLACAVAIGVFVLGRSAGGDAAVAPVAPTAVPVVATPTARAISTPTPVPPPVLVDLLGEGRIVGEIDFGNRTRAAIWCRETVPGTSIGSTLSLLHFAESIQFGDQLIRYEELTKPRVPQTGRRGVVLETEGLGAGNFAGDTSDTAGPVVLGESDGSECERCAPETVVLAGEEMLIGSCVHGVPLRAGIAYVVARPVRPGQTPLALLADCGTTWIERVDDRLVISAEAPLLRGLHEARFPLPSSAFERVDGWFRSDDLELFDWNCDVDRSTQLQGRHLLRTEPLRRLSFTTIDSLIGEIGVHGSTIIGLVTEQCSAMTAAWWSGPAETRGLGRPIADLLGVEPPSDQRDWFYTCQLQ